MSEEKRSGRRITDIKAVENHAKAPHASTVRRSIITSEELKSQLRVLVLITVIMFIIGGGISWWVWQQQIQNQKALCAIRREAQDRVNEGRQLITQYPYGAFGLSRVQIQQSIIDSIDTVTALQNLGSC